MIAITPFVERLMFAESAGGGPGQPESFDDIPKELMKKNSPPAGPEVGKGPAKDAVPNNAQNSNATGPAWGTAFKRGTPDSQEKGTGSTPPSTVDGPSKDNPNTFIK